MGPQGCRAPAPPLLLMGAHRGARADVEASDTRWEGAVLMPEQTMATASSIPSLGPWQLATGTCARLSSHWCRIWSSAELWKEGPPSPYSHHPLTVKFEGAMLMQNKVLGGKRHAGQEAQPSPAGSRQPAGSLFTQAGSHGRSLTSGMEGGQEGRGFQLAAGEMAQWVTLSSGSEKPCGVGSKGFAGRLELQSDSGILELCGLEHTGSLRHPPFGSFVQMGISLL